MLSFCREIPDKAPPKKSAPQEAALFERLTFESPLGPLLAVSGRGRITALRFEGWKGFPEEVSRIPERRDEPILKALGKWLESYFAGEFLPPPEISPLATRWENDVYRETQKIAPGETKSYGDISLALTGSKDSSRAVASALSRNMAAIMIPCHRVLNAKGGLHGYAGGLERKKFLLRLEGASFRED
ncbi:MAG: methylated-DNA--[protein]-cysteine S-methyltransferase [Deltaproteobacteria bacterium]|jgi:methylated-DNA-[protein]-cysteine S-methyltransferase|nr:methylated-DNA--[protein]-cysteine S-methyltransferase [Deltaproteobacteria bacterium]